jgi:hypothetical protein
MPLYKSLNVCVPTLCFQLNTAISGILQTNYSTDESWFLYVYTPLGPSDKLWLNMKSIKSGLYQCFALFKKCTDPMAEAQWDFQISKVNTVYDDMVL